jgi:hypothetical protein
MFRYMEKRIVSHYKLLKVIKQYCERKFVGMLTYLKCIVVNHSSYRLQP